MTYDCVDMSSVCTLAIRTEVAFVAVNNAERAAVTTQREFIGRARREGFEVDRVLPACTVRNDRRAGTCR